MVPELRLWAFDCASFSSCLVPSICLGGRIQYLLYVHKTCVYTRHKLLLYVHKMCVGLTKSIHWGNVGSLTKQFQREYWIQLFIVVFVFHFGLFHWPLPHLILLVTPFPQLPLPSLFLFPVFLRKRNKFLLLYHGFLCSLGSYLHPCPQDFTFYPTDSSKSIFFVGEIATSF